MTFDDVKKVLVIVLIASFCQLLLRTINIKRDMRGRQIFASILVSIVAVASVFVAYSKYDSFVLNPLNDFFDGMVIVWNILIVAICLVFKLILNPIAKAIWSSNEIMSNTSDKWYIYDEDVNKWFLKQAYKNMRDTANVMSWAVTAIAVFIMSVDWVLGEDSEWWLKIFPMAAVVVVTEFYNFLAGYTRPEYERLFGGEEISARNRSAYYKLRRVYEELFPSALLVSHTGNEYLGREGSTNMLRDMAKSDDSKEREVADYFLHLGKNEGSFDTDLVKATNEMMHGKSVVIFNPYYRDLTDYLLLPLVSASIFAKKGLVITGRDNSKADIKDWLDDMLYEYGKSHKLWRTEILDDTEKKCEIGIISFSQIYDVDMLKVNKKLFEEVGFILVIETSRMLATAQIGMNIISEYIGSENHVTVCAIDRDVDGLVDTLSHVFKADITSVVAAPIPRSVYTMMGWDANGDYKRQKMFSKETRYLGNGIELSAVALKNQIKGVTWYSAEKAPIEDLKWIAGQYYPAITRYANLPNQQHCLDDKIEYRTNIWGSEVKDIDFVVAEDEFCNIFEVLRMCLSRGSVQSFVNVISENYLLRDYMRYNRQLFATDAKAIPAISPSYARTERNMVLKLILMMADSPIDESVIEHEFALLDIRTDDLYSTMMELIAKYTDISDSLITVRNRQLPGDDLLPVRKREYFITDETFEEYFASTIKNAYFVVENEEEDREIIDAKLFGHITQIAMPKQILVHNGKAYSVVRCTPKVGCVLRRASDEYNGRLYYKQLRNYHFIKMNKLLSARTVYDIGVEFEAWDFSVDSSGYLEMKGNNDLRTSRIVDLSDDPSIRNYHRNYVNKNVLKLTLPDTDEDVRFTFALLLSEMFRSIFPESWSYIAVVVKETARKEGILDKYNYHADGDMQDNAIYILEDSDIDMGILEAVDNNLVRILEILEDYLEWHFEKIKEPPMKDPVLDRIVLDEETIKVKESIKSKLARRIKKFFGVDENKNKVGLDTSMTDVGKVADEDEDTAKEHIDLGPDHEEKKDSTVDLPDEEPEEDSKLKETVSELSNDFNLYGDSAEDTEQRIWHSHEEEKKDEDKNRKTDIFIDDSEIIKVKGDEDELVCIDELPSELDIIMPIEPSRYQSECYLNFGYDKIDKVVKIERVRAYLGSRGLGNNNLTKSRKRERFEDNLLDFQAENCCDFCGKPLSGISYDVLADGRIRCNDCSTTAIKDIKEFKEIYSHTEMMMENIFEIIYPVAISINTMDAIKMSKHTHSVYQPSQQYAARVIGYAEVKSGEYTLYIENGCPKLVALYTIAHEMTHIWQYINWNSAEIAAIYKQDRPDRDQVAMDLVYEGMSVWASIQILYSMGEVYFAEQQEQEFLKFNGVDKESFTVRREDVYGYGYYLYRKRYYLDVSGDVPPFSPFKYYPPLDPAKVREIVLKLCPDEEK